MALTCGRIGVALLRLGVDVEPFRIEASGSTRDLVVSEVKSVAYDHTMECGY